MEMVRRDKGHRKGRQGISTMKTALFGLLIALGFVLGYVESLVPVYLGAPGVKLGLANLVTMIALYSMGVKEAIVINVVRIFLSGFTFGPASAILFSLAGAALSLTVMALCKRFHLFGMVGVSILGGVAHNIGQFLMAAYVVHTFGVFAYLPVLLAAGTVAGALIGLLGGTVVQRITPVIKKFDINVKKMPLSRIDQQDIMDGNEKTEGAAMVYEAIKGLVQYGLETGLIDEVDAVYARNQILEVMGMDEYQEPEKDRLTGGLEDILRILMDHAHDTGVLEDDSIVYRDLFDTKLMNCLMPRPSQVVRDFWARYQDSPEEATNWYYKLSQDSDYIRRYRIVKDMKWATDTRYGTLDITVNLSKPEKDPKAIAAAKNARQSSYPKCQLCMENVGYAGRANHPARNNHRIIPITINDSQWGFQYSPYVYYNEHCIVFNGQHTPMKIDKAAFRKLFDFIKQFPHYFLGSNADLPIVGGSILSHDHFQGGHYTFAMARAAVERHFTLEGFGDVEAGIVFWPMSVLRLRAREADRLIELGDRVLEAWRGYTDEAAFIFAETEGEPHNTITPIARKVGDMYELDLVLRNNITTDEFPLGLYHPHQELHHIKKENIGLIEVMGLAVLPSRLKTELAGLGEYIIEGKDIRSSEALKKHGDWVEGFLPKYKEKGIALTSENVQSILQEEVGHVFTRVLEDAGVYKCDPQGREAFGRFLKSVGFTEC